MCCVFMEKKSDIHTLFKLSYIVSPFLCHTLVGRGGYGLNFFFRICLYLKESYVHMCNLSVLVPHYGRQGEGYG